MFLSSNNPTGLPVVAPLQTMQRMPKHVPLPVTPVLETSKKKVELAAPATAVVAPPVVQTKTPEGFSPPALEKTVKPALAVPVRQHVSQAGRGNAANSFRPSWPDHTQSAPDTQPAEGVVAVGIRVEDPANMFVITCDVNLLNSPLLEPSRGRRIIHAIYDYKKVMELQGNNVKDKLVTFVINKLIPATVPGFLKAGIGLGTAAIRVTYPADTLEQEVIAIVEIIGTQDEKLKFRTLTIRRFQTNMMTTVDL